MTENEIQRAVFTHLRIRGAAGVFAFHPKNGGSHQRGRRAGINSGLGVVAGVPDVIIIKPVVTGAVLHSQVYALELKADAGKVSQAQRDTIETMTRAGAICAVVHGLTAALKWLEDKKLLLGKVA